MKAIDVSFLIKYLTNRDLPRRDNDWSAFKIRQFLKNESIRGTFAISVGGKVRTFANKDKAEFMNILFSAVARRLMTHVDGRFSIVPIPNSNAVVSSGSSFDTLQFAEQLAARIDGGRAQAIPALRWKVAKEPSHKDGGRNSHAFYENLAVVENVAGPVIVFDDFITSGSQMKAACRRLLEANIDIQSGLVVARVVHAYVDPVFQWETESFPIKDDPFDFDALFNA